MLAQTRVSRGVEQGGYAIFNAQVGYRVNKHVDVSLQLNNIFNRGYYIRPPGEFFQRIRRWPQCDADGSYGLLNEVGDRALGALHAM